MDEVLSAALLARPGLLHGVHNATLFPDEDSPSGEPHPSHSQSQSDAGECGTAG